MFNLFKLSLYLFVVVTIDELGEVVRLQEIDECPNPVIKGPMFEDINSMLKLGDEGPEVIHLQHVLKRYKFYDGDENGKYDDLTQSAVIKFQNFASLETDGLAGPITKGKLK